MASGGPETAEIKLRRHDSGLTWGFRMQGGVDTGIPVFVDDVSKSCTQIILPMFVFANTGGNFLKAKEFDVCGKLSEIFLPGIP